MRYAPVMPPSLIEQLPEVQAYFCFAHIAMADKSYADFFAEKDYVVLDCPIAERGPILPPKEYRQVLNVVRPQFAIIPDRPFEKAQTLRMFHEYCSLIDSESATGVLQGRSTTEMISCALEMYEKGVRRLAIPRTSERNGMGRRSDIIRQVNVQLPDVKWHLLGARWPYEDEKLCAALDLAQSLDTAEPINAALHGQQLTTAFVHRPSDFFQRDSIDSALLYANIQRMQQWLNSPAIQEE